MKTLFFLLFFGFFLFATPVFAHNVSSGMMNTMKTKGCIFEGVLNDYQGEGTKNSLDMLKRSNCQYAMRSIETWNTPPDFALIQSNMGYVNRPDMIYSLFIAEEVSTNPSLNYWYPDENRNFVFSDMCTTNPSDIGRFDGGCVPSVQRLEYRKYIKYIMRRAIDIGVRDFIIGQIYFQDPARGSDGYLDEVMNYAYSYAASSGKEISIGTQTNEITDENYIRKFDYTHGGVGLDANGNIESGRCSTKANFQGYCWALLWNDYWKSKANNVILHLDWYSNYDDDMTTFSRMDSSLRRSFVRDKYQYFTSQNIGFAIPYFAVVDGNSSGCRGHNQYTYSASNSYCNDETSANQTISDSDNSPPQISGGSPSGQLSSGISQTNISVSTDKNAICKYSESPGMTFESMSMVFNDTGGRNHSTTVFFSKVVNNYYIRCRLNNGLLNAATQNDYIISFRVAGDTRAPIISNFSIPSSSNQLSVPISAFSASDNIGITGYYLSENSVTPSVGASGWFSSSPSYFNFSGSGNKMLYAWAKDLAGNISAVASQSILITFADVQTPAVNSALNLATPTNLQSGVISTSSLGIYWNYNSNNQSLTGYKVFRDGLQIATTTENYFVDNALNPGTTYYYQIASYNGSGLVSGLSDRLIIKTENRTLWGIIIDPSEAGLMAGETKQFHAQAIDQYGYPMETSIVWSVDSPTFGKINSNGFFTSLAKGLVNVSASSGGKISYAKVIIGDTSNTEINNQITITKPNNLFSFLVSSNDVKLTWYASPSANFYEYVLIRSVDDFVSSPNDGVKIYQGKSRDYADKGLDSNVTYFYSVFAIDTKGNYSSPGTSSVKTADRIAVDKINLSSTNAGQNQSEKKQTTIVAEAQDILKIVGRVKMDRNADKLYIETVSKAKNLSDKNRYSIASFIQNGTDTAKNISAGDRASVIKSFVLAHGKLPVSTIDWSDVLKVASGKVPEQRSINAENLAKSIFIKIYKRKASISNISDNNAINFMSYGLMPKQRNIFSEKSAIVIFKSVNKKNPSTTSDWNVVRAIAYSGAKK